MSGWCIPILGQAVATVTSLVNNLTGTVNGTLGAVPAVSAPALLTASASKASTDAAFAVVSKNLKELNAKIEELRQALIDSGIMEPE